MILKEIQLSYGKQPSILRGNFEGWRNTLLSLYQDPIAKEDADCLFSLQGERKF